MPLVKRVVVEFREDGSPSLSITRRRSGSAPPAREEALVRPVNGQHRFAMQIPPRGINAA